MENKNSRYQIKKFYTCFADTMEEATEKMKSPETKWTECFEVIDWGEDNKNEVYTWKGEI